MIPSSALLLCKFYFIGVDICFPNVCPLFILIHFVFELLFLCPLGYLKFNFRDSRVQNSVLLYFPIVFFSSKIISLILFHWNFCLCFLFLLTSSLTMELQANAL